MNAPPREIVFRASNLAFEVAVLAVALQGLAMLGPQVPFFVLVVAMGIGIVRSSRGLLMTLRGERSDGPGGFLQPRGIPRTTFERLPTVLLVAILTLVCLAMVTVVGLPGLLAESALAEGDARAKGTVEWADSRGPELHPLQYSFVPAGSEEARTGRAVMMGPGEYRPVAGGRVEVRYVPDRPEINQIVPPQGLSQFPHALITAQLAAVIGFGWVYLISLFIQRPPEED